MPEAMRPIYGEIVARTDAICAEHLTEEYAALADAARLVRIFDSRDKAEAWLSSQEIRPA